MIKTEVELRAALKDAHIEIEAKETARSALINKLRAEIEQLREKESSTQLGEQLKLLTERDQALLKLKSCRDLSEQRMCEIEELKKTGKAGQIVCTNCDYTNDAECPGCGHSTLTRKP